MKILVFSDSHRSLAGMYHAIEEHQPDQVIHLGDLSQLTMEYAGRFAEAGFIRAYSSLVTWRTFVFFPARAKISSAKSAQLVAPSQVA